MKTTLLLAIIAALASCSCVQRPIEDATPLDRPYDRLSAEELHEQNMQIITSNPGYTLPE
jgi:hypothetical protein